MVRAEEVHVLKAMKEARTALEMKKSWHAQRPGYKDPPGASELDLYTQRKPEMVHTFAHNALTQLVDRGILDPKTRYLVISACYMMQGQWGGLLKMLSNAKAAGATEEEMMEVAFIACYSVSKHMLVGTGGALQKVFENPIFQNIKPQQVKEQVTSTK